MTMLLAYVFTVLLIIFLCVLFLLKKKFSVKLYACYTNSSLIHVLFTVTLD